MRGRRGLSICSCAVVAVMVLEEQGKVYRERELLQVTCSGRESSQPPGHTETLYQVSKKI